MTAGSTTRPTRTYTLQNTHPANCPRRARAHSSSTCQQQHARVKAFLRRCRRAFCPKTGGLALQFHTAAPTRRLGAKGSDATNPNTNKTNWTSSNPRAVLAIDANKSGSTRPDGYFISRPATAPIVGVAWNPPRNCRVFHDERPRTISMMSITGELFDRRWRGVARRGIQPAQEG